MKDVRILDLSMGNLRSVQKAFEAVGARAVLIREPEEVAGADRLVLPGVGAFGDAMDAIDSRALGGAIREHVARGRPPLGICLGMQVLFEVGWEGGRRSGLGVLAGEVRPMPKDLEVDGRRLKVPHMGWNRLRPTPGGRERLAGADSSPWCYFVHSYHAVPEDRGVVAATTTYGIEFCSAIARENLVATQFHPEKSQRVGLDLLAGFLEV